MTDALQSLLLFWDTFLASLAMGTTLGFLGVFVLLRRMVFVGVALSQMAALGCAVAFLAETFAFTEPGRPLSPLRDHWLMALAFELLGILLLTRMESGRLSREARIGIVWAAAGALSVLLVAHSARGMAELRTLLTGEILYVSPRDLVILHGSLLPAAVLVALFFRRFLFCAFDREMALSLRVAAGRWDLAFFLALGVAIAVSIHLAGVLFTVGFLVLPGASALRLASSPWRLGLLGACLGAASAAGGFALSYFLDLPTGPAQVAVAFALFLLAAALGPRLSREAPRLPARPA